MQVPVPRYNDLCLGCERAGENMIVVGVIQDCGSEGDGVHHRSEYRIPLDNLIYRLMCRRKLMRELGTPQNIGEFEQ